LDDLPIDLLMDVLDGVLQRLRNNHRQVSPNCFHTTGSQ
jgi:hypothetical protein